MSIIDRSTAPVERTSPFDISTCTVDRTERYGPSEADLAEYADWLASTDAEGHADDQTPVEALGEPCEDCEPDMGDWWASLPVSHELDTPVELPIASASARWMAEGLQAARRRATRGDLAGRDTSRDDDWVIDRLGRVEHPA